MAHDPSKLLEDAAAAFASGSFQAAYDAWTSVLDDVDSEHHYALHTNRGAALERLGRLDDAIEAYDNALQAKPDHVEAWHNRGVALKAQKRYDDALQSFEKALSFQSTFYPALRGRTDVLTALERFDEAAEAADAAIAADASQPGPHADKAFALLKSKRLDEALAEYETAQNKGDESPETRRLYAIALSQRAVEMDKAGDMAGAEGLYTKAITFEPTESRIFNRAFLYMRTGRSNEAAEGFRQVMQLSSTNFQARAALGTLMLQTEDFEEAAAVLKEAQDLKPDQSDIVFNLGFSYLKQGALDDAEAQFTRALELDPSMAQAQNGLDVVKQAREGGSASVKPKYRLNLGPPIAAPAPAGAAKPAAGGVAKPKAPPAPAPPSHAPTASRIVAASSGTTGGSSNGSASALDAQDVDGFDGEVYTFAQLKSPGPFPPGIDTAHREGYLSVEEFVKVFGCTKSQFYAMPKWKRVDYRKKVGLF